MTVRPATWLTGTTVPADVLRLVTHGLVASGPAPLQVDGGIRYTDGTDLQVVRGTAGLSVSVKAGTCLVPGTETGSQAGYALVNDATIARLDLTAASSANPRTDRIVARVVDTGVAATNTYTIEPVTGDTSTPGAPVPALPANSLPLARVYVPINATLSQLQITDDRTWLQLAAPPDTPSWSNVALSGGAADGGNGQSLHRCRLLATGQVEIQFDVDTTGVGTGPLGILPSFARPTAAGRIRFRLATPSSSGVYNAHMDLTSDGEVQLYTQNRDTISWVSLMATYTP